MNLRLLRYLVRELRRALRHTSDRAFALTTKVALYSLVEGLGVVALLLGFTFGFNSCSTTKHVATTTQPAEYQWHTCLMQNAQATLTLPDQTFTAACTMQTVRDSLVVISLMPMLGIELFRIEATPDSIIGIDKMNRRYATASYDMLAPYLPQILSWQTIQQFATGELPGHSREVTLGSTDPDSPFLLRLTYPERLTDVPLRAIQLNRTRYQRIDLAELWQ